MNETDLSETFSHLRRWGLKPAQMQAAVAVMATDSASRLLRVTQVQRESLLVHDGRSEFAARQHPASQWHVGGQHQHEEYVEGPLTGIIAGEDIAPLGHVLVTKLRHVAAGGDAR
jgi:hypothetical protein